MKRQTVKSYPNFLFLDDASINELKKYEVNRPFLYPISQDNYTSKQHI